ncbi:MAG: hypothetical protein GXO07_04415 [Crenarchaeota archaeon]|nr:hypothetical protein [Thermoproteota archaeon]
MWEYLLAILLAVTVTLATNLLVPRLKRYVEKKSAPRHARVRVPHSVAVVDASNVVLHGPKPNNKGRIENLLIVMDALKKRGFEVYAVADASLRYKVDKPEVLEKLLNKGKVLQTPAGTPADYFILSIAEREYGLIISNDVFKEWREQFPWVRDKYRVVKYLIAGNEVYFYPDVRPKRKKRRREVSARHEELAEEREEREDWSKYYVM